MESLIAVISCENILYSDNRTRGEARTLHAVLNTSGIFGCFIQPNSMINQFNPKGQYLVAEAGIILN
jgi:hypothetical protein